MFCYIPIVSPEYLIAVGKHVNTLHNKSTMLNDPPFLGHFSQGTDGFSCLWFTKGKWYSNLPMIVLIGKLKLNYSNSPCIPYTRRGWNINVISWLAYPKKHDAMTLLRLTIGLSMSQTNGFPCHSMAIPSPYPIHTNHPNWRAYFSEGLKPPTYHWFINVIQGGAPVR